MTTVRRYEPGQPLYRSFTWGDATVLVSIGAFLYLGVRLAIGAPTVVQGPEIGLHPRLLPHYALRSIGRMAGAYALSLLFTLIYGYIAAYHRTAEKVLLPLLDILQSVPILSFLPVVALGLSAILPERIAVELASITLIFTSQAWNMTFSWHQSLKTVPQELREASHTFGLNWWLRLKTVELPFAAGGLIWNSMMSWAGGWFFLMAAEMFVVGQRDYRLPGLGAYLQEAASQGNVAAIGWGLGALIIIIVLMDQLIWRPLIAWADRFKLEMVESERPPSSWLYDAVHASAIARWIWKLAEGVSERVDRWAIKRWPPTGEIGSRTERTSWIGRGLLAVLGAALVYGVACAGLMLLQVPAEQWVQIFLGLLATTLRVGLALGMAMLWAVPLGVLIGTNPRLATLMQPLVQVVASIPATALFPILVMFLASALGGLSLAAVLLMLMGTQWYVLFNAIAGAMAIPQDLKYTTASLGLRHWERWRVLILPAIFPYLVTGAITASGGAWNASIVAEYVEFGGQTLTTTGLGALISEATARGDYPLLLAATLTMIVAVTLINRLVWRRLYRLAEKRYRME